MDSIGFEDLTLWQVVDANGRVFAHAYSERMIRYALEQVQADYPNTPLHITVARVVHEGTETVQ